MSDPVSLPTKYTPSLSGTEDFPSAFDKLAPALNLIWRVAFGYELSRWQNWLLRHALEVYPDGHPRAGELRFRQVLVSVARQNGKTEVAAALGLWGLLRAKNQLVIGIASSAEQARLVYKRTMAAIAANPAISKRFTKLTDTRGIRAKDGGLYEIKAAKGAALQGLPIALGIVDEVHLLAQELWTALVAGTGGRPNAMVLGITTAGDDSSELLKELYAAGDKSVAGEEGFERFGVFIWEAEAAAVPDDEDELLRLLMQSSPSLAEGIRDGENVLADIRPLPEGDVVRYYLNRFITGDSGLMPLELWGRCARTDSMSAASARDPKRSTVFSIDTSRDKNYASIAAAFKGADGIVQTELAAWFLKPTQAQIVEACVKLRAANARAVFAVDSYTGKELTIALKNRGLTVRSITLPDVVNASSTFYALTAQQRLRHSSDPLVSAQIAGAKRVARADSWRIYPRESGFAIDALMATATAVYIAETMEDKEPQLFF